MIFRTQEIKDIAGKVLSAVDSSEVSALTDNLEMEAVGDSFILTVASKDYSVRVTLPSTPDIFHATINAHTFLNLISQVTTEDIDLGCTDKYLTVKGNGSYKIPLIYDSDHPLELPKISINNVTCDMDIETSILRSILRYNSKELTKGVVMNPVQRMYYMDEQGAITFTTGACVNNFTLEKPVRILLTNKIVKLFKLFNGESVHFTLGFDALPSGIIQTKVRFEDSQIQLTAILQCDDSLLRTVPVSMIRETAETVYPYSAVINKSALFQAIGRLLTLNSKAVKSSGASTAKFTFDSRKVTITDSMGANEEPVYYDNVCENLAEPYVTYFELNDLKATLAVCEDANITVNFGNSRSLVISRNNIYNIVPESNATF